MLAPIRFLPIYQARVWGGRRLEALLHRRLPDARPYGESWELCDREEAQSVVADGPLAGRSLHELWTSHRAEIFGSRYSGHPAERFPMLLKILDCIDTLSIQVHPPAALAATLKGEAKTEMWFVAHAEPGSRIYAGLKRGISQEAFEKALAEGSVTETVHGISPQRGQYMLVESGRLHALGGGLLVYEIQQNSDTTYRVFDWNRLGLDGKPRDLHVKESLQCIDFNDFEPALEFPAPDGVLARCPYFETRWESLRTGEVRHLTLAPEDFVCLAVVRGSCRIAGISAGMGDFLLLPACLPVEQRVVISVEDVEFLEIRLPVE